MHHARYAEGYVSGAQHCGGVDEHAAHMREHGYDPVAVTPAYSKFVNEHMFPTSGADVSAACAADAAAVCGSATGMVCPSGKYCDSNMRACLHMSPAVRVTLYDSASSSESDDSSSVLSYSNNFGGACSPCSAAPTFMCGSDNGGTVCPRAHRCDSGTGSCTYVSSVDTPRAYAAAFMDASDAMFPYSNNHGAACTERECAVNRRCGPIFGFKVCAAGYECSLLGVCSEMTGTSVSADADTEHSDNAFDACDAAEVHAGCALGKLCGPANGFKVCMAHELCIDSTCVEQTTYETSSFKDIVPLATYSDNYGGACFGCARGEGYECGGDAEAGFGLICPGSLECARHPTLVEARRVAAIRAAGDGNDLVAPAWNASLTSTVCPHLRCIYANSRGNSHKSNPSHRSCKSGLPGGLIHTL